MAERHNAPSQSDQASERSKAEGEREAGRDVERDVERDTPGRDALRTGRGGLDPIELRDVRDETSEKHRRGEDVGASGFSNPTLAEQEEEEAELPPRNTRKAGSGT
jgi:hypothetical protein